MPVLVDDLAEIVARSIDLPAAENRVFEVGGPESLSMNEIVRTMLDVLQVRRPLAHAPVFIPRLGAALLEALLPNPPLSPGAIDFVLSAGGDVDTTALRETFGTPLTPLREGLARYLRPRAGGGPAATSSPGKERS